MKRPPYLLRRGLCKKKLKMPRHSGAPHSGEPGTHTHRPLEYGFRLPLRGIPE